MNDDHPQLRLRPTRLEDARLLLTWRNDPAMVAASLTQVEVGWDEHLEWLESKLVDQGWRAWIALDASAAAVGHARFQREEPGVWNIGVVIAPERRGERLAPALIEASCSQLAQLAGVPLTVIALIRQENAASIRSFERAGFQRRTSSPVDVIAHYSWTLRPR